MIKRVLIISLKFAPVHNAHCRAIAQPFENAGMDVRYFITKSAEWLVPTDQLGKTSFAGRSENYRQVILESLMTSCRVRKNEMNYVETFNPDLVIFESPHPNNEQYARWIRRRNTSVKIWVWLHEPYVANKEGHSWKARVLLLIHETFTRRLLKIVDAVLVSSAEGEKRLRLGYPWYRKKIIKIPLIFEDRKKEGAKRRYFTYVGNAVYSRGIDRFWKLIEFAERKGVEFDFQIITGDRIEESLRSVSVAVKRRLKVISGDKITDEQIDDAIRESWAVLCPFRTITQSGVTPIAYMHGTPLISSAVGGMSEQIREGETGFLLPEDAHFEIWIERMEKARADHSVLERRCRAEFELTFDARNAGCYLNEFLKVDST